jgi:hypothetical protein
MSIARRGPPVVVAAIVRNQAVIRCPFCGKKHYHGVANPGHRLSHCVRGPDNPGYIIRFANVHRKG